MRTTLLTLLDENPSMNCYLQLHWASTVCYQNDLQLHVTTRDMALNPFLDTLRDMIRYDFVPFTADAYQEVSHMWLTSRKLAPGTLLPRKDF